MTERARKRWNKNLVFSFWVPAVLSLIVFLFTYFGPIGSADLLVKAVPGVLVLYVGFIIKVLSELDDEVNLISDTVSENRKKDKEEKEDVINSLSSISHDMEISLSHVKFAGEFSGKANRLNDKSKLVGSIAKEAMENFISEFIIDDIEDTVKFTGQGPAIAAYAHFWETVRTEQETRKANANPIVARVTHSNSIDIWLDEGLRQGNSLLPVRRHERKLCEAHGKIFRILVRLPSEAHEFPIEKYLKAAERMSDRGVFPAIIDVAGAGSKLAYDEGYDFITADGLDEPVSLRWLSTGSARYIGGCLVSTAQKVHEEHEAIWDEYIEYLKNAAYEEENDLYKKIKEVNEKFLSEYEKLPRNTGS